MRLVFLDLDDVLEIHRDQLERYGGRQGVRDMNLLQSALAMPQAGAVGVYVHADLFEMAAAYLYHMVKNHPFVHGNKRTDALAAFVFLKLNGLTLQAEEHAYERLVRAAVTGEADKAAIAKFFRKHTKGERSEGL